MVSKADYGLQAGRSRVRLAKRSLDISVDVILPATL
jgi:hypothetical protein